MKKHNFLILIVILLLSNCGKSIDDQNVIFGFGLGRLSVVKDNKVKFYQLENDSWEEVIQYQFVLPNGYKSIFEFVGWVGVIVGNKLLSYQYINDNWEEILKYEFELR